MNTKILLNERPHGEPNLGNFKTVKEEIRTPNNGEVLLKTIYMSLDPYMRGRMNDAKSYAKPVEIGEVMEAGALSQVIESKSKLFKIGDFVEGRHNGEQVQKLSWRHWNSTVFEGLEKINEHGAAPTDCSRDDA